MFKKIIQRLKIVRHYCKRAVMQVIKWIIGLVPKNKNLILFSAWFGEKYQDSSMFMYEYCLEHGYYDVYWYAGSKELYEKLKAEGKPVVYSKSFLGVWKQIRAIMLISSVQLADFNHYLLKNCIYLDLGHGFAIKQSGFEQPDSTPRRVAYEMFLRKDIKYMMASTSSTTMQITCRAFKISPNDMVFCNKPRLDVLFDERLREGKNEIVKKLGANKRIFSYLPTHRSCGAVQIPVTELMDLKTIDDICEKHNAIFLIKKHFYHRNEKEDVGQYKNIFDITGENIETQTLLVQTDVLITDYSACYIDFLLLDRPIVFFAYDLDEFLAKERNLYFPFENNHGGYKPRTADELNSALDIIGNQNWVDIQHENGRNEVKRRYFDEDCPVGNAREYLKDIFDQLIDGTYKSKWSN